MNLLQKQGYSPAGARTNLVSMQQKKRNRTKIDFPDLPSAAQTSMSYVFNPHDKPKYKNQMLYQGAHPTVTKTAAFTGGIHQTFGESAPFQPIQFSKTIVQSKNSFKQSPFVKSRLNRGSVHQPALQADTVPVPSSRNANEIKVCYSVNPSNPNQCWQKTPMALRINDYERNEI